MGGQQGLPIPWASCMGLLRGRTWAPQRGCGKLGWSQQAARASPGGFWPRGDKVGVFSSAPGVGDRGGGSLSPLLTQQRMMSQSTAGGASVFTAFLQAWDSETR